MAVEGDVGVREVVDEQELAFPGEVDQELHVLGRRDGGRRVVRERHDYDLRVAGTNRLGDRLHAARGGRGDDARTREGGRDPVNRVRGRGHDHRVAAFDQHPHHGERGPPSRRSCVEIWVSGSSSTPNARR